MLVSLSVKPFISSMNISLLASALNAIRKGSFSTYVAEMALAVLATMAHTQRKRERERVRESGESALHTAK